MIKKCPPVPLHSVNRMNLTLTLNTTSTLILKILSLTPTLTLNPALILNLTLYDIKHVHILSFRLMQISYNWRSMMKFGHLVRSGQSGLTCTFRASCCSTCLSRAQVPAFRGFLCLGQEKGWGGSKGGPPALVGTREYEQSDRNR